MTLDAPAGASVVQVDGIDVIVEGQGDETLLMIHGWPDTWRIWNRQVPAFAPHMRCVRFTLPGFDVSQPRRPTSLADMLTFFGQVVDATTPGRPVRLLVHDWGAVFGYAFAMAHPDRVSALVGVDIGDAGTPAHLRSLSWPAKLAMGSYQGWLALAWRIGGRLGDGMSRKIAPALGASASPARIGSAMNYPYHIVFTGDYGGYKGRPPFDPPCPTFFVYGERKPFLFHTPAWADALAARPGCRVLGMPTGHWPMVERPEAFNQAVLDWFGGR